MLLDSHQRPGSSFNWGHSSVSYQRSSRFDWGCAGFKPRNAHACTNNIGQYHDDIETCRDTK